jgi:hypothetical protein
MSFTIGLDFPGIQDHVRIIPVMHHVFEIVDINSFQLLFVQFNHLMKI